MFDRKAYMEEYNKRYYRDNIEREKKRSSAYSKSPAGKERQRRWYKKHGAAWRKRNIETVRKSSREWMKKARAENPEKYRKLNLEFYHSENGKKLRETKSYKDSHKRANQKYHKGKYDNDLDYRLMKVCRARIHAALRNTGTRKSERTETLIGCSSADLRKYLESKFLSGMTWDNRGEWEIDHIRPCASFDLSLESERLKCFNFSNLQPLWKEDNRAKGDKYDGTMLR